MSRILLISHELSRTGAPMVLLLLARWLRRHRPEWTLDLLTLKDGALHGAFAEVFGRVLGPRPVDGGGAWRALGRKLRRVDERERLLMEVSALGHRVLYANTVLAIPAACRLKDMGGQGTRVIAHVHEMHAIISMFLPSFTRFVHRVDHFIAASGTVRDELVQHWAVPPERITVVYEFSEVRSDGGGDVRREEDLFEVGAAGLVHWRKGYDLFIQVARELREHHPGVPARFTWVGGIDHKHRIIVENDIRRAGLTDMVRFVGEQEDPMPWFRGFDAFLLPSREDPFPLVCIEVGMLGRPVLCFQGATGIAEVLGEGGGHVLPYMDVRGMADRLAALWKDPVARLAMGEQARAVFARFAPEDRCPAIARVINDLLP